MRFSDGAATPIFDTLFPPNYPISFGWLGLFLYLKIFIKKV
jgi:hypothetical protein